MQAQVQKWGNSLGVRIPKAYAVQLGVTPGVSVTMEVRHGALLVRPKARYRLADLLAEISPRNLHAEMPTGLVRGREAW